jgi:hypothetical protein
MAHSSIQTLVDYWQARRVGRFAPTRASIDPMDFPQLLPQVFIVGRKAPGEYLFRLIGGFIAELHAHDLRGVDFTTVWAQNARLPLRSALEFSRRQADPVHVVADVQAGVHTLPLEMTFLPLTNADHTVDRFMGLYQPTAPVARLRGQPADRLSLVLLGGQTAEDLAKPRIHLATVAGEDVRSA